MSPAYISTAPDLNGGDNVVISSLSTTSIEGLTGSHVIGIDTGHTVVYQQFLTQPQLVL